MEATSDRPIQPFLISGAFHGLLFLLLLWIILLRPEEGAQNSSPIQIDTITEKKTQRKIVQQLKKHEDSHSSTSKNTPHSVSLADLGMRLNTDPVPETQTSEQPQELRPSQAADDDGWDVMNPDPRVARFNQYIYNTVQGWLDRDAYMNMQPLYGTVKLKIWFTKDGEYLEDETIFDAIDSDFREIVKRALRKSFAVPIPRPYIFQKEKFFIIRTVVVRH
jgi:hypothetical protein